MYCTTALYYTEIGFKRSTKKVQMPSLDIEFPKGKGRVNVVHFKESLKENLTYGGEGGKK